MSSNPITLGTPPQFWWERGVWWRAIRAGEVWEVGDKLSDAYGESEITRHSIGLGEGVTHGQLRHGSPRRPIPRGSEPWSEMVECLVIPGEHGPSGVYRHPVTGEQGLGRETAIGWLQAMTDHVADAGEQFIGQWPGDETDEEIEGAMRDTGITGDGEKVEQLSPPGDLIDSLLNTTCGDLSCEECNRQREAAGKALAYTDKDSRINHLDGKLSVAITQLAEARAEVATCQDHLLDAGKKEDELREKVAAVVKQAQRWKSRAETAEAELAAMQGKSSAVVDAWWAMDSAFRSDIESDERDLANAIREMEQALQSTMPGD